MAPDEASDVAKVPDRALVEERAVAGGLVGVDDLGGGLLPDLPAALPEAPLQFDLLDVERREGLVEAADVVPCCAADQQEGAKRPVDRAGRVGFPEVVVGGVARRRQHPAQRRAANDRADGLGEAARRLLVRAVEVAERRRHEAAARVLLHEAHEARQAVELRDRVGVDDREVVAGRRGEGDGLVLGVRAGIGLLDQHALGVVRADQLGGAIAGAVGDDDDRERIAHVLLT